MMYLVRIALRNVMRRRSRTLVIGSILAIAVVFFLLMESLMVALMDLSFQNAIDFETPHIEVSRQGLIDEEGRNRALPLEESFRIGSDTRQAIEALTTYQAAVPILDFSADFIAGRHSFPVSVRSIEPAPFQEVFRHHEHLQAGSFLEEGQPGVVIGQRLAEFFELDVGDFITLRFRDQQGSFNTMEGEVRGILDTPHPEVNMRTVLVNRQEAADRLGLPDDAANRWMIRLSQRQTAPEQAQALQRNLADSDLVARSYREAAEFLVSVEAWGYIETYFILALFLLVGAVGIAAAIVLSALERVSEIGIMKAMGLRETEIVRIFLLEAGGIGLVGGLIGCLLGAIGVGLFAIYGLDISYFLDIEALSAFPLRGHLYGAWNPGSFLLILAIVVVISLLSGLLPARLAAKKDPIDAIRRH